MPEHIRIESGSRWDTLELVDRLPRCRWYLVEQGAGVWDVHLEASSDELLAALLQTAETWARDRHVDSVVHLSRQEIHLAGGQDAAAPHRGRATATAPV